MRVSVVVPTYNERENIRPLLDAIKAVGIPDLSILFVDDSSPDGTSELIKEIGSGEPWVHLRQRRTKEGLGRAYLDGLKTALATLDPEVVVIMDGDLQHPPATIKELLRAVEGGAGLAIASRYTKGGGVVGWDTRRRMVSLTANFMVRTLIGVPARDCTSGFRALRRPAVEHLIKAGLPARGFEFNVLSVKTVSRRMKVVEVPFVFRARRFGKSKLKRADILNFFVSVVKIAILSATAPARDY